VAGLQRRTSELEEAERRLGEELKEREAGLQESARKHREEAERLEGAVQEAGLQHRELSLQVSLAEGRARGLEEQLSAGDAARRDLQQRLAGLSSVLRRTLGIGRNGRSQTPGSRARSPSPCRAMSPAKGGDGVDDCSPTLARSISWSPVRSMSPSRGDDWELELDTVQAALRDFLQELREAQRDR
ncbi:hypothetical protein JZ751_019089, partial [Albula glossodonta]